MGLARFKVCRLALLAAALLAPAPAAAQTQLDVDQIFLGSAPCRLRAGSGSPEGAVTGNVCDTYWRTSNGDIYIKESGTGNTGWALKLIPATVLTNSLLQGPSASAAWTQNPTVGSLTATSALFSPSLSTASGNVEIEPNGDAVLAPGGNDVLPGTGYTVNLGALTNKYLTLHAAELWVQTLIAQSTMATIGGRILVLPTTTLTADLGTGGTSIVVKHNNIANGDRLFLEANGSFEAMAVTSGASGSGPYTYSVTRNLDGSGANAWSAGDAVANTGTTGDGFIDLYSVSGVIPGSTAGPTIVGNVRTGTTYNQIAPRWAIGNLKGLYGYSSDIYGTAFGDPSNAWLKIDATNGVRIGHNSTTLTQIDASGNASFAGAITSSSGTVGGWSLASNHLFSGSGDSRVGFCVSGTCGGYTIYVGSETPSAAEFSVLETGALTATSATISGAITATSGNITAALQANSITTAMLQAGSVTSNEIAANTIVAGDIASGTITATQIASGTITADRLNVSTLSAIAADLGSVTAGQIVVGGSDKLWLNDDDDCSLHIGGATKGAAPFKVACNGDLSVGGNAELSGAVTVTGALLLSAVPLYFSGIMQMEAAGEATQGDNQFVRFNNGGVAEAHSDVVFSGSVEKTSFAGGGDQYVCVNNSGVFFASSSPCN